MRRAIGEIVGGVKNVIVPSIQSGRRQGSAFDAFDTHRIMAGDRLSLNRTRQKRTGGYRGKEQDVWLHRMFRVGFGFSKGHEKNK